jgi:hypothetical protein
MVTSSAGPNRTDESPRPTPRAEETSARGDKDPGDGSRLWIYLDGQPRSFEADGHDLTFRGPTRVAGVSGVYRIAGGSENGQYLKPAHLAVAWLRHREASTEKSFAGPTDCDAGVTRGPVGIRRHSVEIFDRGHMQGPRPEGSRIDRTRS